MPTFVSIRIITADLDRLVAFYERLLGRSATRLNPLFAELRAPTGTLAFGDVATVRHLGRGLVTSAANRSVIIELQVTDVDDALAGCRAAGGGSEVEVVQEPETMPWGNRSALVRDPDGNLLNLFAPVTAEAKARFAWSSGPAPVVDDRSRRRRFGSLGRLACSRQDQDPEDGEGRSHRCEDGRGLRVLRAASVRCDRSSIEHGRRRSHQR